MTATATTERNTTTVKVGRWSYPAIEMADGSVVRNAKRDGSGEWLEVSGPTTVTPTPTPTPTPEETPTVSDSTVTASRDAILAFAALTPAARKFMALVGHRRFDFFDGGIAAGEGNWGAHMSAQAADMLGVSRLSIAGVMAKLAASGLWEYSTQSTAKVGAPKATDTWWTLTADGAEVALLSAAMDRSLGR